jgi:hypothetical protein
MDPFTVSTGVAGFLSLAIEITKILSTYISDVKSAPEDAKTLLAEVTALCSVLEDLVKFLRYDFKGNFTPTSTLYAAILACQKEIQNLSKKLDNLQGRSENKVKGIIKRVVGGLYARTSIRALWLHYSDLHKHFSFPYGLRTGWLFNSELDYRLHTN